MGKNVGVRFEDRDRMNIRCHVSYEPNLLKGNIEKGRNVKWLVFYTSSDKWCFKEKSRKLSSIQDEYTVDVHFETTNNTREVVSF